MRITRHARRRMRLYRISRDEVELVLLTGKSRVRDGDGTTQVVARVRERIVVVVLAADDPGVVVTIYTRRR